ncbi:unnamed protein product [Adineta steineri]|uniref:Uncharacterized protein n=1 Tax=Adineta steineri TaxID=433720 RepID=A0A818U623_9BILA|nr:unnamed protein product [Adineta steineri]CAF3688600.1 unnamed protein product [Adineta steineri]
MQLKTSSTYVLLLLLLLYLSNTNTELIGLKKQFKLFVKNVASTFHENWRRHYLSEHPHTRNRFKLTQNGSHYNSSDFIYPMILTVGSCLVHRNLKVARARFNSSITYVDILNMNYDELPVDWAYENRATAQVACRQVLQSIRQKLLFNRDLVEKISKKIHNAWIKRNAHRTAKELLSPYENLPEVEKDKDRRAFVIACRLFNELHLYHYFKTTPIHLNDISFE